MILSVFGVSAPPGVLTLYGDNGGPIRLGQRFYRYGGLVPEGKLIGVRLRLPSLAGAVTAVRLMAWVGDLNMANAPARSVVVPVTAAGYVEGTFTPRADPTG